MSKKVFIASSKSNEFEIAVKNILKDFDGLASTATAIAVEETADWAVDELKQSGSFNGRKYKNSWSKQMRAMRMNTTAIVHNKKYYRLSHLLEFGHVKQNGGRTREFPHIAPIANQVERVFLERLEANIKGFDSIFEKGG